MNVTVYPSQLKGAMQAPASKSSMQRACAAALLLKGTTTIHNPGHSNDDKAAMDIIRKLGAAVEVNSEKLIVKSEGYPLATHDLPLTINCGESGLSIRMFTPIVSLSDKEITITGSGSLITRPMDFFDEILPALGVKVKSNDGKLPMTVQGPLVPGNIEVDGSVSSQFLTGLLMAYAVAPPKSSPKGKTFEDSNTSTVSIKVRNLKSKPYIDLTIDVMKKFGMRIPENRNNEEFIYHYDSTQVPPSGDRGPYTVEGDWSGGAFLIVAGAIAGSITIKGLDPLSTQADRTIINAMMKSSAAIIVDNDEIKIHPGGLRGFEFDATDCPDLFPPLVALAAYCEGHTKIKGVSRLAHKESDRAITLQDEFDKMGVAIDLEDDMMIIHGGAIVKGADVHSHHDHRIAMACAVAALGANSETVIEEAMAVKKSYPDFYEDLKSLGANVSLPSDTINS